jgi:16S rRNA (guanine966-N2)-methyltransferase
VFLDPPFAADVWTALLEMLPSRLAPDALVYRESGAKRATPAGWQMHKEGRAGQVSYQLLKRIDHDHQSSLSGNV